MALSSTDYGFASHAALFAAWWHIVPTSPAPKPWVAAITAAIRAMIKKGL